MVSKFLHIISRFFSKKERIELPRDALVTLPFWVPFYSQRTEEEWQEAGFPSLDEALFWQWESCGISCLQMVIEGLTQTPAPKLYDLIQSVKKAGGYNEKLGWIHQSLVDKAKEYGLTARKQISLAEEICGFINKNKIVVASVGVGFEEGKKRSHLVVVTGYRTKGDALEGFIVHHPSAQKDYEWPNYFVDLERFKKHFSGNIMIFSK